jgi:MSHA pilin protein MshC
MRIRKNVLKIKNGRGFTMLEVLIVLVILGILAIVAVNRAVDHNAEVYAGADALKSHLRYAQTMAMNTNPTTGTSVAEKTVWGIRGTAGAYWLFSGSDPAAAATYMLLPDNDECINPDKTINLAAKKIKLASAFTVYFDYRGIPYTAYTSSTANTPLAAPLTINIQPLNSTTPSVPLTITPFTGYIK